MAFIFISRNFSQYPMYISRNLPEKQEFYCNLNVKVVLPSAIAPRTRIPDSLTTHSGWKSNSFRRGKICGRSSSRNTLARTSSAAAEHFPEEK